MKRRAEKMSIRTLSIYPCHLCHFTWSSHDFTRGSLELCGAHSAKIKAMCNAVPYDEFKQLVAGANLKPLDKTQSLMFVKPRGAAEAAGNVPFYSGDLPKAGKYVAWLQCVCVCVCVCCEPVL